ncbi:MAG: T9SS type A sorting domain-containing protein [Flavobacteriales bacterium]
MKTIIPLLLMCVHLNVLAQLNCDGIDYEVSTFTEAYTDLDIEDVTSLTNGLVWDDPEFQFPIGFEFLFYNQSTSDLAIGGDLLGAGVIGNPVGIKNSVNVILPAYADYTDRAYADGLTDGQEGSLSHISYLTEGEKGSRVFKLEWKDVGFYNEVINGTANNFMNVQLWLYEEDNSIEFRYGNYAIEDASLVFDGVQSPISALICSLVLNDGEAEGTILSGTQDAPLQQSFNNNPSGFNEMPDENRVYRWERIIPASVTEESIDIGLMASPVPFSDELTLSSIGGFDYVELLDLTGKVVFNSSNPKGNLIINTAHLPSSIYFIRAEKDGKQFTKKVVK